MHQKIFKYRCIFIPHTCFSFILQRKETLCLFGDEHLFASTLTSASKESQSVLQKPTVKSFSQHIRTMTTDL